MEIRLKTTQPLTSKTDCLVVAISDKRQLSPTAKLIDDVSNNNISKILKRGDFDGKLGKTRLLNDVPGVTAPRVLLVGTGKLKKLSQKSYRKIFHAIYAALKSTACKNSFICLPELEIDDLNMEWKIRVAAEALVLGEYKYTETLSQQDKTSSGIKTALLYINSKRDLKRAEAGLKIGVAIANGMNTARQLGNLPGNTCTPTYLAKQASAIAKANRKLKVTVLDRKDMQQLKMGALLAVAQGSREAPRLIVMEYKGAPAKEKPIALVGKGITFDSGGISIKPGAAMDEMKFDMCGAAGVIGTMQSVAEMGLNINVVAVVPSCENMPDGLAIKPGDVVTSMSGQTIEILNTDAEGRLILCDALTYVGKFEPKAVIDTATLTGACVVALGGHCSGLLGNNDKLINDLLTAGEKSTDRTWQLPLWPEYDEQLKSNFADMANIGGRSAGTITAACFLSRYTKKYKWAHIDIAGVAWNSGSAKGATGRPVPLLTQYILDRCK